MTTSTSIPRVHRVAGAVRVLFSDFPTSPAHAWRGPNGTGKTSRQIGLALPFEGSRFGGGEVSSLIPNGHEFACSYVELTDGRKFTFDSRQPWVAPEGDNVPVIVRPASWLIALGQKRARAEVLERWAKTEATNALVLDPSIFQKGQVELWNELIKKIRDEGKKKNETFDASEMLGMIETACASIVRAENKRIRALEDQINTYTSQPQRIVTKEVHEAASQKYAQALRWEAAQSFRTRQKTLIEQTARYTELLNSFNASMATYQSNAAEAESMTPRLGSSDAFVQTQTGEAYFWSMAQYKLNVLQSTCPVCTGPTTLATVERCASHQRQADEAKTKELETVSGIRKKVDDVTKEKNGLARIQSELADLHAWLVRETNEVANGLKDVPESSPGDPIALRMDYESCVQAKANNEALGKLIAEKSALDVAVFNAQAVGKAAKDKGVALMRTASERITASVMGHLPDSLKNRFVFSAEQSAFFMKDPLGNPRPWRDMNGAQYAALSLALAQAWAFGSPAIMLLEYGQDLAEFDMETLTTVLEALADAAHSGVLMGVYVASAMPLPLSPKWSKTDTAEVKAVEIPNVTFVKVEPMSAVGLDVTASNVTDTPAQLALPLNPDGYPAASAPLHPWQAAINQKAQTTGDETAVDKAVRKSATRRKAAPKKKKA